VTGGGLDIRLKGHSREGVTRGTLGSRLPAHHYAICILLNVKGRKRLVGISSYQRAGGKISPARCMVKNIPCLHLSRRPALNCLTELSHSANCCLHRQRDLYPFSQILRKLVQFIMNRSVIHQYIVGHRVTPIHTLVAFSTFN